MAMNKAQRPAILFQVAGLRGRLARLPRRGRLALYALGAFALAWFLGVPQAGYRHLYVWLAYPVELVVDSTQTLTNPHQHVYDWAAWTRDIDARYAWLHTRAHGGLDGAIAMELLVPLVFLGVIGWRGFWFFYTRPRPLKPSTAHGSARWMTRAELRTLAYKGTPLLLGARDGVLVALDRAVWVLNVMLIGPIGSGKTAGVILPNLLRETGQRDLIISDLKLELLGKTYRHLAQYYDVWVLNFGSPATSLGYNPLSCCVSPLLTALWCNAWIRNTGANEKEPIWDNWARDVMMAGIFHLQAEDSSGATVTLAHLDDLLNGHSADWVIAKLRVSPSRQARKLARGFMANLEKNSKLLGSVWSEISPKFMLLSEPTIQATTSTHEIKLSRLGSGEGKPVAIFLALDPDMIEELRPLTASFFLDVYRTLGATARMSPGGALARDVMIYGDEWGNIGFVPRFTTALNLLRSAGVYGVYVFQTTGQAVETYEEQGFIAIKAACGTKIGLSNMVDDDAKWFSESVLGQATEVAQSSNVQRGRFQVTTDRGGASQSETKRALLTPDEVMNIREDELLVKMPQKPAARLTQRRYYDDPEVRDRAPSRGESWIPPLGPARAGGPLEAPEFDDALDEDDEPAHQGTDDSGRAPMGGQGGDEATAGDGAAFEEPNPFGDDLVVEAAPDH